MKLSRTLIPVGLLALIPINLGLAEAAAPPAEQMAAPTSMAQIIEWHQSLGLLGDWTTAGTTRDMWEGLPSGLAYTEVHTTVLSDDETDIINTHQMVSETGEVISTGAGGLYWDSATGIAMGYYSGFDMGKPFSGVSKVVGLSPVAMKSVYTETSRGATTTYEITRTMTGANQYENSVVVSKSDAKPWVTTYTRENLLKKHLGGLNLIGTWETKMPNGLTNRINHRWDLEERMIVIEGKIMGPKGAVVAKDFGLIYWDAAQGRIHTQYFDATGTRIDGYVQSLKTSNGKTTMVTVNEGSSSSGEPISAIITRYIDGDTMTSEFSDMMVGGESRTPSWAARPLVSKRVKGD